MAAPEIADAAVDAKPRVTDRPVFRPPSKRPIARIVAVVLLLAVVAAVVARRFAPKPVVVTKVVRGTALDAVYATGTVEALDRVVVKAKISGSISELKVREGQSVKRGDLLAVVDSPTLKFELAKGKTELWAASSQAGAKGPQLQALAAQARATQVQLDAAKDERERVKKLVAAGTATQVELDKVETNVAALEAQLAAQAASKKALEIELGAKATGAGAAVDSIAARLADTEVRSPLDGVVLGRSVEPGEVVMLNQPLFRVGDVGNLVIECHVDEADVGKVAVDAKTAVSLYAFAGKAFRGTVFEVLPDADRAKKSFLTRVRLDDPPSGLRSGMSAEVNVIAAERPGALLAPADAIDVDGWVWIANGGRAERRKVTVGVRDMLRAEILDGLAEGDEVVVSGADALSAGARVKTTEQAAPTTAAAPPRPKAGI